MRAEIHIRTVFFLLLMLSVSANAQQLNTSKLFEYSSNSPKLAANFGSKELLVTHSIKVNQKVSSIEVGGSMVFPLPDGEKLNITITQKELTQNGDTQVRGTFGDDGVVIITFGSNVTYANLYSSNHNYAISIDADQTPFLVDNKRSSFDVNLGDDMLYPPDFEPMSHLKRAPKGSSSSRQSARMSGKSEVTLLIIYSSEFGSGFANPLTRINQMIAFTNDAYTRSGIDIELKLAHAQQINFNNSSSTGTLLSQVTNASGAFAGVPALRNQYYADMVAVLPFVSRGGIAGIAWVNGDSPDSAYSISQFAPWGSDSLFAHEIGHNLGSGHERVSANSGQSSPCKGGYTGYSCGHGNGVQGTIMSYLDDAAWSFVFSNPLLDCNGEACGIANGSPNPADNKVSFNITGPLIENFRVDTSNDDDKDGVKNDVDNCPLVKNSDQTDTDSDAQGDACDADDDNDNLNDNIDNCPLVHNPDQIDTDENGIGDACDSDICIPIKLENSKVTLICL